MKKVTVFVPITMYVKADGDQVKNVQEELYHLDKIIGMSEMEASPKLLVEQVSRSEIFENTTE